MSLDFMKSSHAKRAYEIVVGRKLKRLSMRKEMVISGIEDSVVVNSGKYLNLSIHSSMYNLVNLGPEDYLIPVGFKAASTIPELSKSLDGEIVMVLWDLDMNGDGRGDPVLGWYRAKIHSFCHRPPYNFILKYSKELTGNRKLDGFVNTTLDQAGIHGYGRRWVHLVPLMDRIRQQHDGTRGSGEEPLSKEEQEQLDALLQEAEDGNDDADDDDIERGAIPD
jgi:hypothetical protein